MKKSLVFMFMFLGLLGCENDGFTNNNPFLPNYSFTFDVNMNLPTYSALQYPSNGVRITQTGVGVRGIFVFNAGSGNYVAYEAACPNQALSSCSTMTLNGIMAVCPCDDAQYSLFTGTAAGQQYPLKPYRVEVNGSILRIYN